MAVSITSASELRCSFAVKSFAMPPETSQIRLWSHIQTERLDVFEGSQKRLDSLARIAEKHANGRTLLNIGCGNGYLERAAKQRNWKVLSVDPDRQSIERLQAEGIEAHCGLIESLPIASDSVNAVICTEVFEHLKPETMETGLKEIRRVLVPGGVLIGSVPYRENLADNEVFCPDCKKRFHRWGHEQSFDEAKLQSVLSKYLSVRKVHPVYWVPWISLNWKGKALAAARKTFAFAGVHNQNSNLLFIAFRQ